MSVPTKPQATFCKGYKYQLREDCTIQTEVYPEEDIFTELVILLKTGELTIMRYFAHDGCSGCTIDDEYNFVPCLVHDALAYLMRMGFLPVDKYFKIANKELGRLMELYKNDSNNAASWFGSKRANLYRWFTDHCGTSWASKPRKLYTYPRVKQ